jgi:seryl-tRNA synthetase
MLDIKFIKNNIEEVKRAVKLRKLSDKVDIDSLVQDHDRYLAHLQNVEDQRNLRNNISRDISRVSDTAEKERLLEEARSLKEELAKMESKLSEMLENHENELKKVPNVIAPEVPEGLDESENVSVRKSGVPPEFDFEPRDHVELGKILDMIDIDTAGKVSGSRFYYLKNEAVFMELAITRFVFDSLADREVIREIAQKTGNKYDTPFTAVFPPLFIKGEVAKKMDRFDPIEDRYYYEKDEMMLIGSAEHSLGPMHMDENLNLKDLPIRYIGFSPAFRREAGSYGKDTKGIIRVHHFDKLEMESFSSEEDGMKEQDLIVGIQEYLVSSLELPYQVVQICTGDMGKPDYRQIDIETWIPSQKTYRETHTSDYMTDFQARRLNTTYTTENGDKKFVHMNDATAFAVGRILVAIMENNQQKDGSVTVPSVLQKYTGFTEIRPKNMIQA